MLKSLAICEKVTEIMRTFESSIMHSKDQNFQHDGFKKLKKKLKKKKKRRKE